MADNSRIEDLRKRYHENPRRFFAPLANEYRKAGLLDRALLLCQKHVPEQPENMNGLVVFGQTLFELGQHDAARDPFESALRLDPENLIALRHLGDIARLLGDVPAAKGWYEKVLELDRRNDEVLDLLAQLGGEAADAPESPSARPTASGLISVAPSVSVSGGAEDIGMIDLGDVPAPAPKPPAGKGGTVVINAQALADRDRREAEGSAVTQPVPAVTAPAAEAPAAVPPAEAAPAADAPPRPSKRASLLDIDFDFSEMPDAEETTPPPPAPMPGAEAAEVGFAEMDLVDQSADTLIVETTGDVAPLGLEPTAADASPSLIEPTAGDASALGLEPTIAEPMSAPAPEAPAADLELADFSAEVSPLAGLEASEFTSEQVAPMAELEADSVSMSLPSVAPLEGLDRPDAAPDEVAPIDGLADLPLLDEPSAAPPAADADVEVEPPSARPKPRMTKADLASLPLLADFGLEDEPAAPAEAEAPVELEAPIELDAPIELEAPAEPQPPVAPRASKATPTFVTETMAALYVQQGLLAEAIGVYRQLVSASPADEGLKAKLVELERMHAQEQIPAAPAPSAAEEMPEFDAPADVAEPEPAPANAAMDDVSFGEIALKGQGSATPIVTPAVSAGPTAREFFGGFARRAAVAAAIAASVATESVAAQAAPAPEADADAEPPTVASASVSPWPLDALFGAASDVRDLHAAETLAGVGTFEGPDGGTGLDDITSDAAAPKRQVPRASETLKFDQFFQKPGTAAPAEPAPDASAPGDDDLDQFQDWLKGLKP